MAFAGLAGVVGLNPAFPIHLSIGVDAIHGGCLPRSSRADGLPPQNLQPQGAQARIQHSCAGVGRGSGPIEPPTFRWSGHPAGGAI